MIDPHPKSRGVDLSGRSITVDILKESTLIGFSDAVALDTTGGVIPDSLLISQSKHIGACGMDERTFRSGVLCAICMLREKLNYLTF
jgi:hypothetical protein